MTIKKMLQELVDENAALVKENGKLRTKIKELSVELNSLKKLLHTDSKKTTVTPIVVKAMDVKPIVVNPIAIEPKNETPEEEAPLFTDEKETVEAKPKRSRKKKVVTEE